MKTETLIIRKPQLSDKKQYLNLINNVIDEGEYTALSTRLTEEEEAAWLTRVLEDEDSGRIAILCAEEEGTIIGNCMITKGTGANAHLGTLGVIVHTEHRREGVGSILIAEAIEKSKGILGVDKIILQVRKGNSGAYDFYQKLGFADYGELPQGLKVGDNYYNAMFMFKEVK